MTIKIRKRKPKNGIIRLYLDIYDPKSIKKRTSQSLNLYLFDKPNANQKKLNKDTLEAAERIQSKTLLNKAYENNDLSKLKKNKSADLDFLVYYKEICDQKFSNEPSNYSTWASAYKHLKSYCPNGINFRDADAKWIEGFKNYLNINARTSANKKLADNSKYSYFNKVKAAFNKAFNDGLIDTNPAQRVKGFKQAENNRVYLTQSELEKLAKTECDSDLLKSAFLFSSLTGMRWSDVVKLTWGEIYKEEEQHIIRFTQKKTKGVETLPVPKIAIELIGARQDPFDKVFKGLKYSSENNLRLKKWALQAGILKKVTFHTARHTYATMQMTFGTDIYTLSKLLGHRELRTTQIYAQIIDKKKEDASNKMDTINI